MVVVVVSISELVVGMTLELGIAVTVFCWVVVEAGAMLVLIWVVVSVAVVEAVVTTVGPACVRIDVASWVSVAVVL